MNINTLQKDLKGMGYDDVKQVTSKRLVIFMEAKERVTNLKVIADRFKGKYSSSKTGSGWRSSVGAALLPNGFVILAKPSVKGNNASFASLDARVFSGLGKNSTFLFNGKDVKVVTFTDYKKIEASIIDGCKKSRLLGQHYAEIFESFFSQGKLEWSTKVPVQAINKLGVYVGELLVGWALLKGAQSKYFASNPFVGRPMAFHIPTDPAFSGVDSFIEMRDNSYYAISSKYGAGAKASIFTNLFEQGIEQSQSLEKSVFKDMCQFAKSNSINHTKSKEFVYNYGVYHLLGIKRSEISDPTSVFTDIRTGKSTDDVNTLVSAISKATNDKAIVDQLPQSASAYFNRRIADELNNDKKSIEQMRTLLAGKDYWQANLQTALWAKGGLQFKFISSRAAKVKIYGNKSSIVDITCKQGWLNYELRY